MVNHWLRRVFCLVVAGVLIVPATSSQANDREYVRDALIVKYRKNASELKRSDARKAARASRADRISPHARDLERYRLPKGMTVEQAMKILAQNPDVEVVEPDWVVKALASSNDTLFLNGALWGMYGDASTPANQFGSGAAEAWAAGATGSSQVLVGVIDEGIDVRHPDLAANIWVNPFDPVDGIDNDGNGYIDDVNGWDFANNDASVFDGGTGDVHGTHVAGTIGAQGGNGAGVAGVNWSVKMISAKFLGASGGTTSDAIAAVLYINDLKRRHGLDIVATNNSWGGGGFSQQLLNAINAGGDLGILFIAAAGNEAADNNAVASFPANISCTTPSRSWDCVLSVAAIGASGALATFSNFGVTTVDLGAPGVTIQSTRPNNTYGALSGTSMAAPHVAGAAALCASVDPSVRGRALRDAILTTTQPTTSLNGRTSTGGRLDAGRLLTVCQPPAQPLAGAPEQLAVSASSQGVLSLTWVDGAQNESEFELQRAIGACSDTSSFATIGFPGAGAVSSLDTGLPDGTSFCYRIRAISRYLVDGVPMVSAWSTGAGGATLPEPPPYICSAQTHEWLDMTGSTALTLGDDTAATVTLPFAIRFYGTSVNSVQVSSNGFVRFLRGSATEFVNTALPEASEPNGIAAVLWDDLDPSQGGRISTRSFGTTPNRRFAIAWEGVPHWAVAGSAVTAQLVLDETTGNMMFNYRDVQVGAPGYDGGASATVGIENATGTRATQLGFNQAVLADLTSYRCGTDLLQPPATPSGLAATVSGTSTINVRWVDVASENGYILEISSTAGVSEVALPSGATTYSDAGLAPLTTRTYRIRSVNDAGLSPFSAAVSATTQAPIPDVPSNVRATPTNSTTITVAWTDVANETRYNVERTSPTGVVSIVNLAANVISYRHTGLVAGDIWRYRVRASNATGASAWSAQVSTTPDGPPVAPTLATATLTSPSTVSIGWRDNASNEVAFEIGRQTLNPVNRRWGATQVVATAAALPGLGTTGTVSYAPGAAGTYRFQVRATNTRGNSAWSAVTAQVVVTP